MRAKKDQNKKRKRERFPLQMESFESFKNLEMFFLLRKLSDHFLQMKILQSLFFSFLLRYNFLIFSLVTVFNSVECISFFIFSHFRFVLILLDFFYCDYYLNTMSGCFKLIQKEFFFFLQFGGGQIVLFFDFYFFFKFRSLYFLFPDCVILIVFNSTGLISQN